MKILVFSDLHIHDYKQFNKDSQRLKNCLKVLRDVADFAQQYGITDIFFGGDLYDTQRAILTSVVNSTISAFIEIFGEYPEITWWAITGNHDQSQKSLYGKDRQRAESALYHIRDISNGQFQLLDDMQPRKIGAKVLVQGIPYLEYAEHFNDAVNDALIKVEGYEDDVKKYLLIHQTPKGFNPMVPYEVDPNDKRLLNYDHVFCGHIHKYEPLAANFTVIGNPLHRDLGDAGQKKGFLVFNALKPELGVKFMPLAGYPEFREIYESNVDSINEPETGGDYYVVKPDPQDVKSTEAKMDDFSVDLTNHALVENYWEKVDGKDKELLAVGISCLR